MPSNCSAGVRLTTGKPAGVGVASAIQLGPRPRCGLSRTIHAARPFTRAPTPSPLTPAPPFSLGGLAVSALRGVPSAARDRGRSRVAPNLTRPAAGRVEGGRYPLQEPLPPEHAI